MYTLKGIFPEPRKEQKRNFIKENMRQLKLIQTKSPKDQYPPKTAPKSTTNNILCRVTSSPSNKSGKATFSVGKNSLSNAKKKQADIRIKKGDMAEFLKRKEMRQVNRPVADEAETSSEKSSGRLRDIGCQTIDSALSQRLAESTKLTMLYPKDDSEKLKASGDSGRQRSDSPASNRHHIGDDIFEERNRSRVTAILEKKDSHLPPGYQRGVLPKYLRDKKEKELESTKEEDQGFCPPGHVTLPDNERKETLRMLRNSFAELISELNKLPVKTDTLRMKNRKMELEKQLAKLEEGIKVFSRPKVFVKIGE